MGDFNYEVWAREYIAHSILRGVVILSESVGPIQSRLYNASIIFGEVDASTEFNQEFNTMWVHVMESIERYTDKNKGIINCSHEKAKNIISDIFTCLYCVLDYNSKLDVISQMELSK